MSFSCTQVDHGYCEMVLFTLSDDMFRASDRCLACRTTGEFAAMTLTERQEAAETTRRAFPGVVLNNISTCCLQDALILLEHSQQTITTERVRNASRNGPVVAAHSSQVGWSFTSCVCCMQLQTTHWHRSSGHNDSRAA